MVACRMLSLAGILLVSAPLVQATIAEDAYLAGYATAALKHDLKLDVPALAVKDGVITLPVADINRPISFRMNHVKMAAWREQKNEAKSAKKLSKL
jgi:hypothetical protein